ncbi:MAG TPA: SAM-dependent methyltransferase [Streptosporangiaceae bacterium]|nr:SAM-dependent methyltransferase [Streptosporangiaceae bacterium]
MRFGDVGSGLPTAANVHQIARRLCPGTKVVYVDNDPVVLVHARALLAGRRGDYRGSGRPALGRRLATGQEHAAVQRSPGAAPGLRRRRAQAVTGLAAAPVGLIRP